MTKANNVTALRKAVRNASHIYGKVEWAEGCFVEQRLVKEDILWSLRKDHSELHPEEFEFRTDTRGAVHIGRMVNSKGEEVDYSAVAEELAPVLQKNGILLMEEDMEAFSQVFKESLRAFAEAHQS